VAKPRLEEIMLTKEEKQIVIDALIFSSCCDICANWNKDYQMKMLKIAKRLGTNPSENIELFKGGVYEDEKEAIFIDTNFNIRRA
jgi:hypothetical protein